MPGRAKVWQAEQEVLRVEARGDIPGLLVKPAAVARENRLTG